MFQNYSNLKFNFKIGDPVRSWCGHVYCNTRILNLLCHNFWQLHVAGPSQTFVQWSYIYFPLFLYVKYVKNGPFFLKGSSYQNHIVGKTLQEVVEGNHKPTKQDKLIFHNGYPLIYSQMEMLFERCSSYQKQAKLGLSG